MTLNPDPNDALYSGEDNVWIPDPFDDYDDFEEPHEIDCPCIYCIPGA